MLHDLLWPWRRPAELWWKLVHLFTGLIVGSLSFTAVFAFGSATVALLITFPLALPVAWLLFATGELTGRVERSRFAALLGEHIADPVPPLTGATWWARLKERARTPARRRLLYYGLLRLPFGVLGGLGAQTVWGGSLMLILLPAYVNHLPGRAAEFWLFSVGPAGFGPAGWGAWGALSVGVAGLVFVAPWATRGLARLDLWFARRFLGPPPAADDVEQRVARLEASRTAAVDGAEAERRRIERDLHDGAQQRLVAMAVNLGAARDKLDSDPEAGRLMVDEAHQEAKEALRELRDLVRGIHPVILEDRGLDAALSAVVARLPVPVDLDVQVTERPSAVVESAVYFVVAEALTNVARHAEAERVSVAIVRAGPRLVVEVTDDGVGGAAPDGGTGLLGLRDRVQALNGRMDLISPQGGPTTLMVELPCGS